VRLDRQLQRQPRLGIIQIDRRDLADAFQAILQGVAMDEATLPKFSKLRKCGERRRLIFIGHFSFVIVNWSFYFIRSAMLSSTAKRVIA